MPAFNRPESSDDEEDSAQDANARAEARNTLANRKLDGVFNSTLLLSPILPTGRATAVKYTPVPIEEPKDPLVLQLLIKRMTHAGDKNSRAKPRAPHLHFEKCLWAFMNKYDRVIREDDQIPIILSYKNTRNLALCHIVGSCDEPGSDNIPIRLAILLDMNAIGFQHVQGVDGSEGVDRSDRRRYVISLFELFSTSIVKYFLLFQAGTLYHPRSGYGYHACQTRSLRVHQRSPRSSTCRPL